MTVGRSGSTALMESLHKYDDIALPSRDTDCEDDELLNPEHVARYMQHYAKLCGCAVTDSQALIETFYRHHDTRPYAGFKSMPDRHPDFAAFVARPDIRFIGLIRRDVPSTVASFLVALEKSTWRRHGEPYPEKWKFDRERHGKRAQGNLAYILNGHAALMTMPNVIRLTYEDLCAPGFRNEQLDEFFGREIRIENPRPPTHGSSYVENWEEFVAFLRDSAITMRNAGSGKAQPVGQLEQAPAQTAKISSLADIQNDVEQYLTFIERSRRAAAKHAGDFKHLKYYCMFVGYPRSGHSIVGSMLDAHPNMVVAQELDALRCLDAGMGRQLIFHLLMRNSEQFTRQGRVWNGYTYQVPNQWQGRFQTLEVIGDKKGGRSSTHLVKQPEALDRLRQVVGLPLRMVHVIRNPYDNIATFSKKHNLALPKAAEVYFLMADGIVKLKDRVGQDEIFDLRHEDFIADPRQSLARLCGFFGQSASEDYLDDCAGIVYKSPHQSRHEAQWPDGLADKIQQAIERIPFLQGYTYDN